MAGTATVIEEGVALRIPSGVFYNHHMELCRGIGSLALGALGGKLSVIDGMCASGARGLRYRKENANAVELEMVDIDSKAASCAKANAKRNGISCRVRAANVCDVLRDGRFDFVELDPFGSPAPYLHDAARSFAVLGKGWLSLTATDMAVLCGAHHSACLKNYWSAPLDNEFCHENAVRILAARVAMAFSQFNLAAMPAFTLSHRHYVKMLFRIEAGAEGAVFGIKARGFVSYCPSCCARQFEKLPSGKMCAHCGHELQTGGPLSLLPLWDGKVVRKMIALNAKRKYSKCAEIERLLRTIALEEKVGAHGYYDLHALAKKTRRRIPGIEEALSRLRSAGFHAERTHFCPTAVRTDAPHGEVLMLGVG